MEGEQNKLYGRLGNYLSAGDAKKALLVCEKLLKLDPSDGDALAVKCQCLIWSNKIDQALTIADQVEALRYERAYCYYRKKQNEKALKALQGMEHQNDLAVLNLKAQILYRIGRYDQAAATYDALVEQDVGNQELRANWVASHTAAGSITPDTLQQALPPSTNTNTYELLYNVAGGYAATRDYEKAKTVLDATFKIAQQLLIDEGLPEDEVEAELASVKIQQAYVLHQLGLIRQAENMYIEALKWKPDDEAAVVVAANNLLVLRGGNRDLFDSYKRIRNAFTDTAIQKLTPQQKQLVHFNRTLLLLHMKKREECKALIKQAREKFPESKQSDFIEAALYMREKKFGKCEELLRAKAETGDNEYALALGQIYLANNRIKDAVQYLLSIEKLRYTPGMVSAVTGLYEKMGSIEDAQALLEQSVKFHQQNGNNDDALKVMQSTGAFLMRHSKYRQAAQVYEKIQSGEIGSVPAPTRLSALASLVIAYSQFDPELAETKAASLPMPEGIDSIDADQLEGQALPITSDVSDRTRKEQNASEEADLIKQRKEANRKAKLEKRKAKRRERYLQILKERHKEDPYFSLEKHLPDPERWVPKHLREKNMRYRKRRGQKLTGGQGAGDMLTRDAAKLDARGVAEQREIERKKKEEEQKQHAQANKKKPRKKGRK